MRHALSLYAINYRVNDRQRDRVKPKSEGTLYGAIQPHAVADSVGLCEASKGYLSIYDGWSRL